MKKYTVKMPEAAAVDPVFDREWRKMLGGEVYDAVYGPFIDLLIATRRRIKTYNETDPADIGSLTAQLRALLGTCGEGVNIVQPFRCDYGLNIHVGRNFMANFNFTVLDEALVTFGDNVFIGPNVGVYTACHPTDPEARRTGCEWALPVTVGSDVWIGGGTTILPGVTIGDGVTIGAGSVVVRDIPAHTVAVGNPCRVVKKLS